MQKKSKITPAIKKKAERIRLLIMDVDGVLTPGYIVLGDSGREIKFFDVQDGFGLSLWRKAGLKSAIITAGATGAVEKRAGYLKIDSIYQGAKDKLTVYNRIKDEFKVDDRQICFIGDDLLDLPILKRAGLACCVLNANQEVLPYVHYISRKEGGRGAVREIIDMILKIKGLWDKVSEDYFI
jgi:3-deoxy-D-manno-octulosonate 8-phosphate phosphatase (KDO 8-P phosphatase)